MFVTFEIHCEYGSDDQPQILKLIVLTENILHIAVTDLGATDVRTLFSHSLPVN